MLNTAELRLTSKRGKLSRTAADIGIRNPSASDRTCRTLASPKTQTHDVASGSRDITDFSVSISAICPRAAAATSQANGSDSKLLDVSLFWFMAPSDVT